jgi:NADH dehydrogenase
MGVRPRVVIIGSGFGGLNAARALKSAPVDVTVVDRDNYVGFWPLLYQVATAGLGADDIAYPVRATYAGHPNIRVRLATATGVDLDARLVHLDGHDSLPYDFLIVSAGSSTTDFGLPGVSEHTFALKTLPDAVRLRNHILTMFEHADAGSGERGALIIVLVGGGPTGVELAGALSELISRNLSRDFTHLDVTRARVVVVEKADRLLPGFSDRSAATALAALVRKGVEVRFGVRLAGVDARGLTFEDGSSLDASTIIWTAGVAASPLAGGLAAERGRGGAVVVRADLSVAGHPEVFVVGDLAAASGRDGRPLPQLAPVAIQGGRHAARTIRRQLSGRPSRPFRYHNHGIMATIGRREAVAELPGGLHLAGTLGWVAWLVVHLFFLVGFRNRIVAFVNWAWNYLTWDRASRVILDDGRRITDRWAP